MPKQWTKIRITPKRTKQFFERVSRKSAYLNPEIVEEVWAGVIKVVFEDLKEDEEAVLPYLTRIYAVRHKTANFKALEGRGLTHNMKDEEYYRLYTATSPRLRKYFKTYLERKKALANLVPESPSTLVK